MKTKQTPNRHDIFIFVWPMEACVNHHDQPHVMGTVKTEYVSSLSKHCEIRGKFYSLYEHCNARYSLYSTGAERTMRRQTYEILLLSSLLDQ